MSEIINGKEVAKSLRESLAAQVVELNSRYGRTPNLVVILVGEDPGSVSYVTGKAKAATEIGIRNTTLRYPDTITEKELLDVIAELNADEDIDGILVLLNNAGKLLFQILHSHLTFPCYIGGSFIILVAKT